jgi:hypothetical protein
MIESSPVEGIALPMDAAVRSVEEIVAIFREWRKRVVTFLGFGELGYEDEEALARIVREELRRHCPNDSIINTGTLITQGFHRGIADAYEVAKEQGFTTTGVHPSVALCYAKKHYLSPYVDRVLFVCDATWGGYLGQSLHRSPMLDALVAITDEVAVVGGGKHTAEEMQEFLRAGKPVRFYAAEMNHRVAREWYGLHDEETVDYRGAAYHAWAVRQSGSLE